MTTPASSSPRRSLGDAASLSRTVVGTAVGNFTEWFDFGIYSYVVVFISQVFFPDSSLATLATFGGLAVSFIIRPVGGIFWGLMGDRFGRRTVLASTVLLMAGATFLLGLLPGHATIGIWAPVLLFVLRGVQGFSAGGEYIGAMVFLGEHSPSKRRGYIVSFLPIGTLTGYITGAMSVVILQSLLSEQAMLSWGWRVPFLCAFPLGLVGLYLRMRLEETPAYQKQQQSGRMDNKGGLAQIRATLAGNERGILTAAGLTIAFNVTNYMLTGYFPDFLPRMLDMPSTHALLIIVAVMGAIALVVTFIGRLGDRIGRKPILVTACGLLIAVSLPMFWLTLNGNLVITFLGVLLQGMILACFMGTVPATLPALFPTNVRYGATSAGYSLSVSAFGGTTPLIAAALVEATGNPYMPALMLMVAGAVGALAVCFTPNTAGKPLPTADD